MDLEHTGSYYRCDDCGHIYDYDDDACPDCGSGRVEDINSNDVKNWSKACIEEESERLLKMLESHDDL